MMDTTTKVKIMNMRKNYKRKKNTTTNMRPMKLSSLINRPRCVD